MNRKKLIGALLIALAAILLVGSFMSIYANMAHDGPMAGKLNTYKEPFRGHFVLMVFMWFTSVLSLLSGLLMIRLGQNE